MLAGALSGVEMGLRLAGVPHNEGGVTAALQYLAPKGKESAGISSHPLRNAFPPVAERKML
jgi:hypothetical protein